MFCTILMRVSTIKVYKKPGTFVNKGFLASCFVVHQTYSFCQLDLILGDKQVDFNRTQFLIVFKLIMNNSFYFYLNSAIPSLDDISTNN